MTNFFTYLVREFSVDDPVRKKYFKRHSNLNFLRIIPYALLRKSSQQQANAMRAIGRE